MAQKIRYNQIGGGTDAQFLKADGSADSNTYAKESDAIKNQTAVFENKSFKISGIGQAASLQTLNSFFSSTYYSFNNGFFIQTNIPENVSAMVTLELIGNSYSLIDAPISTIIQCYSYNNTSILNSSGINNGLNINNVEIFVYNGFLCFWLTQQNTFTTLRFVLTSQIGNYKITSVTNASKPISGTSRNVVVTPVNIVTNNLLTKNLNDVKTPGFYTGDNPNATLVNNYPVAATAGSLRVYKTYVSGTYLVQEFTTYNNGTTYRRFFNNTTWTSWVTIWDSNNFNPESKENSFAKNTAFNKNFGTSAGTVAEGNDARINNGQTAYSWGNHSSSGYVKTNTSFNGYGLQIADHPLDNASGLYDTNYDAFVSGSCDEYWKYGSQSTDFNGINIDKEYRVVGIGIEPNKNYKLLVGGLIKTTDGICSPNESRDEFFVGDGQIITGDREIVNEDGKVRLNVAEHYIDGDPDFILDDDSRLIRIFGLDSKMSIDLLNVIKGQEIVIYHNGDPNYDLDVMLNNNWIFNIAFGEYIKLFVNANQEIYAERPQRFDVYN